MLRRLSSLFFLLPLFYCACYETNTACLDPDASNYDILADEACADCCVFPTLSLDVDRFWGEDPLALTDTFTDGVGNEFRLLRFRVYLTELTLVAGNAALPAPANIIEAGVITGTDTTLAELNANLVLLQSTGGTTASIGRAKLGMDALTALEGTIGFAPDFPAVYPPLAPASSPLSTQADLLNFNDGRGYLTASADYVLVATDDTLRVDVRGATPLLLDFPGSLEPLPGANLTLELAADYRQVFGNVDLAAAESEVANGIAAGLRGWLRVTGAR